LFLTVARKAVEVGNRRRFDEFPGGVLIPGASSINFAVVTFARRIVEELIDQFRRRRNAANAERGLAHAFQRKRESPHVRDFPRHEELKRVFGARVAAEIDQPFVDDLRAGFGRNIAAKVHIEFADDLEIVSGPGIALGIKQIHTTAACDSNQRIGFGSFTHRFQWLQVHPRKRPDDLKMAEFLGSDVHQ
jgi:hypothetical protein